MEIERTSYCQGYQCTDRPFIFLQLNFLRPCSGYLEEKLELDETAMDNFELRQVLLGSIDGAFNTLCELFNHESFISNCDVGNASTATSSGSSKSPGTEIVTLLSDDESKSDHSVVIRDGKTSLGTKIPTDSLTRDQCQKVQHLYTYFGKIKSCSERLQLLFRYGAARSQIGSFARRGWHAAYAARPGR